MTPRRPEIDTAGYRGPERRTMLPTAAQVDGWMPALTKTGFVGLTFLLVWALLDRGRNDLTEIKAIVAAHVLTTDERDASNKERDDLLKQIMHVTVQQCVNGATNPTKIDACFDAITRGPQRPNRK